MGVKKLPSRYLTAQRLEVKLATIGLQPLGYRDTLGEGYKHITSGVCPLQIRVSGTNEKNQTQLTHIHVKCHRNGAAVCNGVL